MKIDIDLSKITDLSQDVKNALRSKQKEIASLERKLKLRDEKIDLLIRDLDSKDYEMRELLHLKRIFTNFFQSGLDTIEKGDKI